jgi:hypothetical protein
MHKRSFIVVIMAVLLIAGMVSSAACEMTCTPTGKMTVCCAQQMQQSPSINHCENAAVASLMSAHQCGHPQENTAVPAAAKQTIQQHATEDIGTPLTALPDASLIAGSPDTSSFASLHRSSFLAPLRI